MFQVQEELRNQDEKNWEIKKKLRNCYLIHGLIFLSINYFCLDSWIIWICTQQTNLFSIWLERLTKAKPNRRWLAGDISIFIDALTLQYGHRLIWMKPPTIFDRSYHLHLHFQFSIYFLMLYNMDDFIWRHPPPDHQYLTITDNLSEIIPIYTLYAANAETFKRLNVCSI